MLHEFAGYDFYKVPLIQAIIKTFASDTICLSETFLNSSIATHDPRINFERYSLLNQVHLVIQIEEVYVFTIKSLYH